MKTVIFLLILLQGLALQAAELTILKDPEKSWNYKMSAILSAQESIFLSTFLISHDSYGRRILSALEKKLEEGVEVTLIFDNFLTSPLSNLIFKRDSVYPLLKGLQEKGAVVKVFRPRVRWFRMSDMSVANHQKLLVVDEDKIIIGGRNIDACHYDFSVPLFFDDTEIYIEDKVLAREALGSTLLSESNDFEYEGKAQNIDSKELAPLQTAPLTTEFQTDAIEYYSLETRQSENRSLALNEAILDMINEARSSIVIQTLYLFDNKKFIDALKEASRRNVSIIVHTNSDDTSNYPPYQLYFKLNHSRLLKQIPTMTLYVPNKGITQHSKVLIVDRKKAYVGSHNFDDLSFNKNAENGVIISDLAFASSLQQKIEQELKDKARIWKKP